MSETLLFSRDGFLHILDKKIVTSVNDFMENN